MKDSTEQSAAQTTDEAALAQRSRELFAQQVAGIDAHTRSRLNRARQAALAAAHGESRPAVAARWLLPAGSAAALTLMTVSAVQLMHASPEATAPANVALVPASTVADVEILTSTDELDMLQNMDFYAWLDTQTDTLDAHSAISEAG